MAGDDSDLHDFIDAFLAYRRRPRTADQCGSSATGDLLESIVRVDECMEVLETVWPSDTGFPDRPYVDADGKSTTPADTSVKRFGPYEILEQIGRGGMGRVFRARHVHLNRVVAIKILPPHRLDDPAMVARFRREMRVIGQLSHPNIVSAFDADVIDGIYYIAMEYIDGVTLADLVQKSGPLAPGTAVEYVRQAAEGLACAHRCGMTHRDVKPTNLMVTQGDEDEVQIKLLDVGLARPGSEQLREVPLTETDAVVGTVGFIAPEQANDPGAADERSDIYSLGATLFYLLVGDTIAPQTAGRGDSVAANELPTKTAVTSELRSLLRRMIARSREHRFQSMAEVIQALQEIDVGAEAVSIEKPNRLATSARRAVVVAVIGLAVMSGGYFLFPVLDDLPREPPSLQAWTLLSKNNELNNWTPVGDGHWSVQDGTIIADGTGVGWLMLTSEQADVQLRLEYRLPAGGNSGVYLRAWPDGALNGSDFLEIRLCDDNHARFRTVTADQRTGGLTGFAAPSPLVVSIPGTWHALDVRIVGDLIEVVHDDTLVNRINLEDCRRLTDAEAITRPSGHIGLRMARTSVEFRRVQLRVVTPRG